jgi:outer membrane protein assembly factor BamD (BamD/ComL family)
MAFSLRLLLICAVCACGIACAADNRNLNAQAGTGAKRVALVIGNGGYQHPDILPKLSNPTHDAEDIAKALRGFGFEVIEKKDQSLEGMNNAIAEFSRKIGNSEAALFYFAGHGLQVKGQNYLVPVDANIETEARVQYVSVNVNQILDEMDSAKSRVNIVMLDACRNNPISGKFRSGATRGLAPITSQPKGTVIVYATDPGNVAADGEGRNGLFTAGLLTAFKGSDLSLAGVLTRASEEVERGSDQKQTPYINGPATLQKNFQFGQGVQVASLTPQFSGARTSAQIEDELWDAIKDGEKASVFEEYLKQYPKGRYLAQARIKIAKLKAEARQTAATAAVLSAPTPAAASSDPETALWNEVQKGNTADDYDVYLKQYPKGKYIALAKQRLQKLMDEAKQHAEAAEQNAWQSAEKTGTEAAYQEYQRVFPNGRYAALVPARLNKARSEATQKEEDSLWQKAQQTATHAAMQEYINRYPTGRHVAQARAKDEEYQRVPTRPSLPFALDESIWQTLEASEIYRNAPRPRALRVLSSYQDTREYTGVKSRTLPPPAPAMRTKETETTPLGDRCETHRSTIHYAEQGKSFGGNTTSYSCASIPVGNMIDGKASAIKRLGPLSGSLYPPRIGAEQQMQYEMTHASNRKFDSRSSRSCKITARLDAAQINPRLTGTAWVLRCHSEMIWTGGHDGKPIISDTEDYLLEDLGVQVSKIGVLNMTEKRSAIPVPGYQSVSIAEGEYGSRTTSTYQSHEWSLGEAGASLPPTAKR